MALDICSGMVKVGTGYSGLLGRNKRDVRSRLAIATPQALHSLNSNPLLFSALQRSYSERTGLANFQLLSNRGFLVYLFSGLSGNLTFGLSANETSDIALFMGAQSALASMGRGIHRTVILAILGIKAIGVDQLPDSSYAALLAKLGCHLNGQLVEVSVKDTISDKIEIKREGISIVFSKRLLAEYEYWATWSANFPPVFPTAA